MLPWRPAPRRPAVRHARSASQLLLCALLTMPAQAQSSRIFDAPPRAYAGPAAFVVSTESEPARTAFFDGYDAILVLDRAGALRAFERAVQLDPALQIAHAFILSLQGRSPANVPEIDRMWRLSRSSQTIEGLLFQSMRERHAARAFQANLALDAAARSAPDDPRLVSEFHLWLAAGNETRIGIARLLRDRDPANYRYQAYVATALTSPADAEEALRSSQEALRLGPDRPFAHYAAAEVQMREKRYADAIAHYDHALGIDPDYQQATWSRAQAHLYARSFADARRDLSNIADQDVFVPNRAIARRGAALTYLHEGDIDGARTAMEEVVSQLEGEGIWRTQLAEAHFALAMIAAVSGDSAGVDRHNEAQARYRNEGSGGLHGARAFSLGFAGQAVRARAELSQVERLIASGDYRPADAAMVNTRAIVLVSEGKLAEALDALGDADNEFALLIGYRTLRALGRNAEAQQRLERILDATDYGTAATSVAIARYLHSTSGRAGS